MLEFHRFLRMVRFIMNSGKYIRKSVQALSAYVPGEQPKDKRVVKLNTNENPYPPPPAVFQALSEFSDDDLRRYPDPVCAELRAKLADMHGASEDQIICGNGSDEVLLLLLRALVEEDETVGFFDPSYSLYPVLCDIESLAYRKIPLTDEFAWPEASFEDLKIMFITQPNAPTSLLFARDDVEALCDSFDGVVVLDEAYIDFAEENGMDLALSRDNVVVVRSLSKAASLAGIRFGYAVGPEPIISALYKIKDSYNINGISQRCALAALNQWPGIQKQVDRVKVTRDRSSAQLRERGYTVADSSTNFLWVKPAGGSAETVYILLQSKGILVRFFSEPATQDYLRITVGTDEEMDQLIQALDE